MTYYGQVAARAEGGAIVAMNGQWRLILTDSGEYRIQQLLHDIALYRGVTIEKALQRFDHVVSDNGPYPNTRGNLGHGGAYR